MKIQLLKVVKIYRRLYVGWGGGDSAYERGGDARRKI